MRDSLILGREILKFWKKIENQSAMEMTNANINLNERFEDCFRGKLPFNTLGKEASSDIRRIVCFFNWLFLEIGINCINKKV